MAPELLRQKLSLLRRYVSVLLVQFVPDQNNIVLSALGALVPEVVNYFRKASRSLLTPQVEYQNCALTIAEVRLN